uniref:UBA domain-containing protein n=1 Tax=Kalanchoe fedtschenkoi TaxID=63787 RepID=A0A7N0UR72_KALFE
MKIENTDTVTLTNEKKTRILEFHFCLYILSALKQNPNFIDLVTASCCLSLSAISDSYFRPRLSNRHLIDDRSPAETAHSDFGDMPPASKSKSKDKRTGKEPTKASGKFAGPANGDGIPSNGNGELNGHSVGTGGEFDANSNNGSWSGESEEQKDKSASQSTRQESVPGAESDKREKIRQKNERKHQRQKERRAQELHEKCCGYLMSRKLERLSQQLVAMGFSAERATMALIINEGKVNQSVAWLIDEGAEEAEKDKQRDQNVGAKGNLKIDISEELARMADLEVRYKYSKQEVERAVVACEGDIDQAAETLKTQKQEPPACHLKPEENGYLAKTLPKPSSSVSTASYLRDEKDFNYARTVVTAGMVPDNSKNSVQMPLRRAQPQSDWAKPQQIVGPAAEKRWPVLGTSSQAISPVASPLQVSQQLLKAEARHTVTGGESRSTQQIGTVREPVTVMRRQQPPSATAFVVTSIATSTHTTVPSWHTSGGSDFTSNGVVGQSPGSKSFISNNASPNQLYQQQALAGNNSLDSILHAKTNGALSKLATSSTLAPASSLGLFSSTMTPSIPSGSSSPLDWSNFYDMRQIDYANIDWSLDRSSALSPPSMQQGALWSVGGMGLSSRNGNHVLESGNGTAIPNPGPMMRVSLSNGSGLGMAIPPAGAMGEWSSPFEENDIFSLPRQFVSSHSMYEDRRGL